MQIVDTVVQWISARPFKTRRRARLLREPLPLTWNGYLQSNVALYRLLPADHREKLRAILRVFAAERRWEGCGGLSISDEIKVTIAAQACLLLLGMEHDYFSEVTSILVYPTGFEASEGHLMQAGVIHEEAVGLVGQAWRRGPVILAWSEVLADGRDLDSGRNVVIHEFAHQLDFQADWPHKATRAEMRELGRRWSQVMTAEYDRLVRASEEGRATLLDEYGASSPAEFFAVASECFFTQPGRLNRRHPPLYELLAKFYGLDPERLLAESTRA
jgi:Mlc titration factor MtfA (ptsG expression regulator)